MDLQEETADVLGQLIRFNTVNPPGDERECQEWLKRYLEDGGLRVRARRRVEPERPNLVARLRRRRATARCSATSSHVDTVLADARGLVARPVGRASSTTASCGAAARST